MRAGMYVVFWPIDGPIAVVLGVLRLRKTARLLASVLQALPNNASRSGSLAALQCSCKSKLLSPEPQNHSTNQRVGARVTHAR